MLAKDKILHIKAGFLASLTVIVLTPIVALGVVIAAGVGKEIYDRIVKGRWDFKDIIATMAGGFPLPLITLLLTGGESLPLILLLNL